MSSTIALFRESHTSEYSENRIWLASAVRSEHYVQNWKYFLSVVAIFKDGFAVNSDSIYLASLSSTSHKTYD